MKKAKYAFGEEVHIWLYYSCFKIYRISAAQALSPDKNMDLTLVPVWLRTTLNSSTLLLNSLLFCRKFIPFVLILHFRRGTLTLHDNDIEDNDASS